MLTKSEKCNLASPCQPCFALPVCVFLTYFSKWTNTQVTKCVMNKETYKYPNATLIYHLEDCINIDENLLFDNKKQFITNDMQHYNSNLSPGPYVAEARITNSTKPKMRTTLVHMRLNVTEVELDEAVPGLKGRFSLELAWVDTRLIWRRPLEEQVKVVGNTRSNSTQMKYIEEEIWTPKLNMTPWSGTNYSRVRDAEPKYLNVTTDGEVSWLIKLDFETKCELDLRRWPHSWYSCNFPMILLPSKYGDTLDWRPFPLIFDVEAPLNISGPSLDYLSMKTKKLNTKLNFWRPRSSRAWEDCKKCSDPFVIFLLTVQNQIHSHFVLVMNISTCLFAIAACLILLLPPFNKWKMSMPVVECIILGILYYYLPNRLPPFGNNFPLLFIWYIVTFLCILMPFCFSLGVLVILSPKIRPDFPGCLKPLISSTICLTLSCLAKPKFRSSRPSTRVTRDRSDGEVIEIQPFADDKTPPEEEAFVATPANDKMVMDPVLGSYALNDDASEQKFNDWTKFLCIIDRAFLYLYLILSFTIYWL